MDYELKYVIAIFLIVEIAALSPGFSMGQKKEKLEQNNGLVEAPVVASSAAEETPGSSPDRKNRGTYFFGGPESVKLDRTRLYSMLNETVKYVTNSGKIKETPDFDTYEHKIELLESSLKWRNIQKTLHCLNRILSSNHSNMKLCSRKKTLPRANFHLKTKNYGFYQSKTKKFKSFFKRKKLKGERKLMNDVKSIRLREERKIKRKRKHKHKSWKNLSQKQTKKLKSKWKEPGHEGKHLSDSNPTHLDATAILKPNSVLFDVERILMKKAKSRSVENNDCSKDLESPAVKMEKKCVASRNSRARLGFERKSVHPKEGWSGETEARGYDPDNKLPKQKAKAWPHFVYHRVSSNFLHPEQTGHSRRKSAYVAISVATSSKPESTDNYASDVSHRMLQTTFQNVKNQRRPQNIEEK